MLDVDSILGEEVAVVVPLSTFLGIVAEAYAGLIL
jgi:hypothetical protein